MHELFTQVITKKDLSKAGDLFSLDDKEIEEDLSEVLDNIRLIAESADYTISDNDQSVVEICITRVTTAVRETESVERHASALVRLLEVCLDHNLTPTTKDEDTPHAKIASDIMSCVFLHYSKRPVMERTLPTVVRFLACENKELSRNVSSYLSLAAIDNADLLAKHIHLILSSILLGNPSLTRVLPQIFTQNKDPILQHLSELVTILSTCDIAEQVSLFELFALVTKFKPKLMEPYVEKLCEFLSHTLLTPLVLIVLVDIAIANPASMESHLPLLKQTVEQQPTTLTQVAQIIGAVGNLSESHAKESLEYLVGQLASTEHAIQPIVLQEIRALCLTNHSLLAEHIAEINKLGQNCASSVRILVEQLKDDNQKYSGEKEMRSVSSQTEGNVTIITVGNPPNNSYVSGTSGVKSSNVPSGSLRSSEQSLARSGKVSNSARTSGASTPNFKSQAERSSSPTSEKGSMTGSVSNNTTILTPLPVIEANSQRDTIQLFCEKHLSKIKSYINTVSARIPLPAKCCVVNGRHKRYVKLNFLCVKQGDQCLYSQIYFSMDTKNPKTWIHLMFLAIQSRASTALSTQDPAVSSLRACWDALRMERTSSNFLTLVTSAFPSQKDQDLLIQELHSVRYFDVFEFNAPEKVWACFMCNHPDKVSSLLQDGFPVIAGQLKEKKGRWKFLKRWKTRYFTLSGAHITYSKSDSRKETLPVAKIQSVKAVRKGIRDIPRAFEIFTADQTYIFKAKDRKNAEQWVQCLHIAVARTQKQEKQRTQSVKVGRPRVGISDTKL
ncbi:ventricular zone-expressed PH domain-containing protein homolog 1-like isoform X2 [Liolophura sinensis]|uniref:ventricular zone-expressed PH domain-containing protein homolog 1-like isoform X2 n=1 Tax=Liolophura sinensis TaxID=3198878 RepID=UPI003159552B